MDVFLYSVKGSLFVYLFVCFDGSQWKAEQSVVLCMYMHS